LLAGLDSYLEVLEKSMLPCSQAWWCTPSSQEAEAGGLRIQGHPGLHSKTLPQKNKTKQKKTKIKYSVKLIWLLAEFSFLL
jgi:hypothetical protein